MSYHHTNKHIPSGKEVYPRQPSEYKPTTAGCVAGSALMFFAIVMLIFMAYILNSFPVYLVP